MRPSVRFSSRATALGVDKPLRATQAPSKAAEAPKSLRASHTHATLACDDSLCASPASVLPPTCHAVPAAARAAGEPADRALDDPLEQLDALLDASRLLGRLLDTVARALAGRQPVPPALEAVLAGLFPAAASISATLPSADGQGLAVTALLHERPGAPPSPRLQHSEPLGRGVCSFRLAAPPSGATLRLMRAFASELAVRLNLERAAAAPPPDTCRAPMSASPPTSPRPLYSAPAPCSALPARSGPAGMPADCFWMSM